MRPRPCWSGSGVRSEIEPVEGVCELAGAHTGAGGLCVQDLPEWTAPQPGVQHILANLHSSLSVHLPVLNLWHISAPPGVREIRDAQRVPGGAVEGGAPALTG